jgi:hypothetical protein
MSENIDQIASYCDALRKQIEHEDGLIVSRLSWLVASQSFLFTGYAIVMNGPVQTRNLAFIARQDQLLRILPVLAMLVCLLIYLGVIAGVRVMAMLHREVRDYHAGPRGLRPPIQGTRLTLTLGMAAPLCIPPLFAVAWLIVLLG